MSRASNWHLGSRTLLCGLRCCVRWKSKLTSYFFPINLIIITGSSRPPSPPPPSPPPSPPSPPAVKTPAIAGAVTVISGYVASIGVQDGGSGYTSAPPVTISAPNQIPAQVSLTVSASGAVIAAALTPINNGPYSSIPNVVAMSGGPCISPDCTGAVITIGGLTLTGPQCTNRDLNNFNVGAFPLFTISSSTGSISASNRPIPWTCTPWSGLSPVITLATNTLQPPVTATAVASLSGGVVASISVVNAGSGYVTGANNIPIVTIGRIVLIMSIEMGTRS